MLSGSRQLLPPAGCVASGKAPPVSELSFLLCQVGTSPARLPWASCRSDELGARPGAQWVLSEPAAGRAARGQAAELGSPLPRARGQFRTTGPSADKPPTPPPAGLLVFPGNRLRAGLRPGSRGWEPWERRGPGGPCEGEQQAGAAEDRLAARAQALGSLAAGGERQAGEAGPVGLPPSLSVPSEKRGIHSSFDETRTSACRVWGPVPGTGTTAVTRDTGALPQGAAAPVAVEVTAGRGPELFPLPVRAE